MRLQQLAHDLWNRSQAEGQDSWNLWLEGKGSMRESWMGMRAKIDMSKLLGILPCDC